MANQKEILERASEAAPKIINYTRKQLFEYGQSKASNEVPKVFVSDEKRKEKLRDVFKNPYILETFEQMPEWANCGPIS